MKQYRIVRIAGVHYDTTMRNLYRNHPGLHIKSYAEQKRILFQEGCIYSDAFSRTMESIGHDTHEIVYDLKILQKSWATENGVQYDSKNWQAELVLAQIEQIKPDIVYFQHNTALPYSMRKNLKTYFPFIKLIVVYMGFPTGFDEMADVDLLIVGSPALVRQFAETGSKPHLVYHGFDSGVLDKLSVENIDRFDRKYDFTFIGMSGFDSAGSETNSIYRNRYWALVELVQKTNIDLWVKDGQKGKIDIQTWLPKTLNILESYDRETIIKILALDLFPNEDIGKNVRDLISIVIQQKNQFSDSDSDSDYIDSMKNNPKKPLPLRQLFPHRCHPPVFGHDMYRILRQSKVTFNNHIDLTGESVGNMRLFEATGMETCLLTDTRINMPDLFEADREVVTYSNVEECIEKANYLLEHDDVRKQIATAGHKRTMTDHTAANRCEQIDEIIQKIL